MRRRRFSEREVLLTLFYCGQRVRCYRCGLPFTPEDKIQREHVTELALGGEDTPVNCAYSHTECHDIITNGTKATTAGSSKQRIAKVKRLQGKLKPKMRRPWAKRKMQSRPFQKRVP